jgi:protoporphyrinogen oxidase
MTKILILGAGPAGLTLANALQDKGITDLLVLEKESEAGGLCRSQDVDGSPLDIGGGHFLDVRRPKVNEFLFAYMPQDEWDLYTRDSRIHVDGQMVNHPLEANIWQMDLETQLQYLMSISTAGCVTGTPKPEAFVDWIRWKLGDRISDSYMIPYNQKMFGDNLN